MRGRRLGTQPRGVRGDPPRCAGTGARAQRPAQLQLIALETARLRLRPWTRDDLDTLLRWTRDARVTEHLGSAFDDHRTRRLLDQTLLHYQRFGFGVWLAEDRATGAPVGRVGLSYHRAWPDDPEVGWWIDPDRWGEGLATEAGAAAIAYAFETLRVPRVVSIATEANVASRRVMEKLALRKLAEVPFPELDLLLWVHARNSGDATG